MAQPQYRRVAPDQRKSNESKTKKPTDEGWLFACCPKNKTGIAKNLLRTGHCLLGHFKGLSALEGLWWVVLGSNQ
ncbi:hypothetical protein ABE599_22780 [Achromobacter mucicolens]|uniref:hypothetical protein n=1 Tax=Achromobacter TaxID=222 RepID=UPI001D01A7A2|nr:MULTISPECIES: hypothetical protein [Achromobacter]MCP2517922.1 hypothetical protein [Achromobacter mucicolens]UDG76366.1 hypothetical protein H4P35_03085 [Achromobacter sp. 77]